MRLIIGLMFLGSMMMNAQNSCFAWNLKYSYDLFNMDVTSNKEFNQLQSIDPIHTWGFGLKRSMGTIDHLFNLGADVMYGKGSYNSNGPNENNSLVSYGFAFNLSYERALGLRSIAHVYNSCNLLVFESSYRWRGMELNNHYSSLYQEPSYMFLDKNSLEFAFGVGRRIYLKRKYKGTLSIKAFTDLPNRTIRSSSSEVKVNQAHVFGIKTSYSVSS